MIYNHQESPRAVPLSLCLICSINLAVGIANLGVSMLQIASTVYLKFSLPVSQIVQSEIFIYPLEKGGGSLTSGPQTEPLWRPTCTGLIFRVLLTRRSALHSYLSVSPSTNRPTRPTRSTVQQCRYLNPYLISSATSSTKPAVGRNHLPQLRL